MLFTGLLNRYVRVDEYNENYHYQFITEVFDNYKVEICRENHQFIITISLENDAGKIIMIECHSFQDEDTFYDYNKEILTDDNQLNCEEKNKNIIKYEMVFWEEKCRIFKSV